MNKKQLDKAIADSYHRLGDRVEINIMDICKIYKDVEAGFNSGQTIDEAMVTAIAKYRTN